LAGY